MFDPAEVERESSSRAATRPYADSRQAARSRSLILRDWPRLLAVFVAIALATAISVAWIDLPLARSITRELAQGDARFVVQAQFPDLLDLFVAIVTIGSLAGYIVLRRKHAGARLVCCLQVLSTAVPFSYTAKNLLKSVFGRVNTRYWMHHPQYFEFHWLHASDQFFGFPSGHMAVFSAFAFALMHYYPRLRLLGWTTVLLLAAALIVSAYHFLGDVIAGAYIGYLAFIVAREMPGTNPKL